MTKWRLGKSRALCSEQVVTVKLVIARIAKIIGIVLFASTLKMQASNCDKFSKMVMTLLTLYR